MRDHLFLSNVSSFERKGYRYTYPYISTRVKVEKRKLFTKDEYLKMLKMSFEELASYLMERKYSNEIKKHSLNYKGRELLEIAINEHFAYTLKKIRMMSVTRRISYIDIYLDKWNVFNVKVMLRSMINGFDFREIEASLIPITDTSFYERLYNVEREDFIYRISKFLNHDISDIKKLIDLKDIVTLENMLDKEYYTKEYNTFKELKIDSLDEVMEEYMDMLNLKLILRFRKGRIKESGIRELIIPVNTPFSRKIIKSSSLNELLEIVKNSKYKDIYELLKNITQKGTLSDIEYNISKYWFEKSKKLIHNKPLSLSTVFSLMIMKEIEMKNMKILINAKSKGKDEEYIMNHLVI